MSRSQTVGSVLAHLVGRRRMLRRVDQDRFGGVIYGSAHLPALRVLSDHEGSVRLVNARPLSAAGESPPVQIITPSLSWSITLFSLQALRNLIPAALVALRTRRRTAAICGDASPPPVYVPGRPMIKKP